MAKPKKRVKAGSSRAGAEQRRLVFVESYLANGGNGSKAAVAAGFSPATAGQTAFKLLKHAQVRLLIEQRQAELVQKYRLDTDGVLRSLAQAIYFDPRKLYNADGSLKRVIDLDDDTALALASVEAVESTSQHAGDDGEVVYVPIVTKKVKWLDKNTARDQAHKILGHYKAEAPSPSGDPMAAAVDRASAGMKAVLEKFAAVAVIIEGART